MIGVARRCVYRLHFALACLVGGVAFVGVSFVLLLYIGVFRSQARKGSVLWARGFSAIMRTVLGWRVRIEGLEHFERGGSILAGNHQSNLDVVTYGCIVPPTAVLIGKLEILKMPVFGWYFKTAGNILIDRGNSEKARKTIADAAERVRNEGLSVWMFPEGHRNNKETLLPFKKGAFHLAIAAQAPVVVFVSEPITSLLDPKRGMVRPGTIRIRILPPIPSAGLTVNDVDVLLEKVRTAMQSTRDALAADARPRIG